ncbi:MAG TPA: hypothetical protein VLJ44_01760 [Gaiellaceae bacterium]|nr:hypothetical protein [Gaiellaceae bacterium]
MSAAIALAEKMFASLAERQARVEELASLIEELQLEEDHELRSSFRTDPAQRHDATSLLAQIRRKKTKAESEHESLLRELDVLRDESREAAQAANREQAEQALADLREFPVAEQAYQRELKSALVELLGKFCETLPPLWAEMTAVENDAHRLCAQANMASDWDQARDQVHAYRTAENFLSYVDAAVRSIKLADLSGETRAAIESKPSLLLKYARAEDAPTYTEPARPAYVYIDMTSAPLIEVDAPGGMRPHRQWQGDDGLIHSSVKARRSEPSEAEREEVDARTGVDRWRRVDAALLRG